MNFRDMSLRCRTCGAAFTISAEQQELQHSWGITTELKQCPSCHRKSKINLQGDNFHSIRQMYPVTCDACGRNTQVPFKPLSGRRVYCNDCYHKVRVYH